MFSDQGAAYYRFEGIKFMPHAGDFVYNMIRFFTQAGGEGSLMENQVSQLAHDIDFDRCVFAGYVGTQNGEVYRGIAADTGRMSITNSYFYEIKDDNSDSQALDGTNGTGPFYFRNDHFESASEDTMFGGATPNIQGVRASDLTFYGNEYYKPWVWRFNWGGTDPNA